MRADHTDDQILNSLYAKEHSVRHRTVVSSWLAQISDRGRGHQRSRDFPQLDL